MKNLYLLASALIVSISTLAQTDRFYYPDAFYIVKEVQVEDQKERPFHFELAVKQNPADTLSKPRIYVIQVRKGKEDLIGKTMQYAVPSPVGEDWKTYSIDGITDPEATRLWLFVAVNGNGDFYFDYLQCFIADINGTLLEKDLSNPSFEDKKLLNGYFVSGKTSKNIRVESSELAYEGKHSLKVTTSGQKPGNIRVIAKNN